MLIASLQKEIRIVATDLHSIAVLLILPITFMLIMTFAMSSRYDNILSTHKIAVFGADDALAVELFSSYFESQGFNQSKTEGALVSLTLPSDFDQRILLGLADNAIKVQFNDDVTPQLQQVIVEQIKATFAKVKLHFYMRDNGELDPELPLTEQIALVTQVTSVTNLFDIKASQPAMSATLFSVPTWIVFGIYFIVLPISITTINEKYSGTLVRLKTFPISSNQFFIAKLMAYCSISAVQLALLIVVGTVLVPLITEQPPLTIAQPVNLIIVAFALILSANCFAFFISTFVNSFEQAIVFGGGINIILAAVSGFMVPIDVMPKIMADIATWSPLYWAAEALRSCFSANNVAIAGTLFKLFSFSFVSFALSIYIFKQKIRNLTWN